MVDESVGSVGAEEVDPSRAAGAPEGPGVPGRPEGPGAADEALAEALGATAPLYYLRTFHAVAALGGFTRAAGLLHLSQPAVSGHIRALERSYGSPLFVVRHRRTRLTPAGEVLFAFTERIFNLVRGAARAVAATQGLERGTLTVGASTTVGVYLLPRALGHFARAYPGVQVALFVGTSAEVRERVLADRLPLGLVEAPLEQVAHPDLDVRPFGADELVLVAAPEHPWARAGSVDLAGLHGSRVLRREAGAGTRAFIDAALVRAGVDVGTAMELGSTEALKQAALAGLGVTWVSRVTVQRELESGALVAVRTPGLVLTRPLWRIAPRGLPLPPAAGALLALLSPPDGPSGPSPAAPTGPPAIDSGRAAPSRRGGRGTARA